MLTWIKSMLNIISKKAQDHDFAEKITSSIFEEEKLIDERVVNYILYNKQKIILDGVTIVQKPLKHFSKSKNQRDIKYIVTHWDATLSSHHCYNILDRKGISTHLSIDNNGIVYQFVDLNDVAWHAGPTTLDRKLLKDKKVDIGKVSWNADSIGIDFSNAYYIKYNKLFYEKRQAGGVIHGPRPIIKSRCQNMDLEHLGYYPAQVKTYGKLLTALTGVCNIEKQVPVDKNGMLETKWTEQCAKGKFRGIICHYHLTPNKIDCAGLELDQIVEEISE
jgi:hypothetical protein